MSTKVQICFPKSHSVGVRVCRCVQTWNSYRLPDVKFQGHHASASYQHWIFILQSQNCVYFEKLCKTWKFLEILEGSDNLQDSMENFRIIPAFHYFSKFSSALSHCTRIPEFLIQYDMNFSISFLELPSGTFYCF